MVPQGSELLSLLLLSFLPYPIPLIMQLSPPQCAVAVSQVGFPFDQVPSLRLLLEQWRTTIFVRRCLSDDVKKDVALFFKRPDFLRLVVHFSPPFCC